jgi:DNA-binding transcriptional regulator YiaG
MAIVERRICFICASGVVCLRHREDTQMTGQQLRRIRTKELHLSQAKLAAKMKVTAGHIARLERNERAITGLFEVALEYVKLTHKPQASSGKAVA